ncbi:MAG: proline dehydrogenase family protein [Candidatus Dormibacteraeota bacterium]|nr:proline dehydrogenase family protein [Candidatus Dormibacteraeota bacterium]
MGAPRDAWDSHSRTGGLAGLDPAPVLRHVILWASRRSVIKQAITRAPLTRELVRRFVPGEDVESCVAAARELRARGLQSSLVHLGEDTHDTAAARAAVDAYRALIVRIADEGLSDVAEVAFKLSALGQALDESMAFDYAAAVCEAARGAGIDVTVDMEDHTTTDSTLRIVRRLRADYPDTGAVLQASLHRSPEDCEALAHPGSRIRLCKGAYQEPPNVAWQTRGEVRSAYLRCLEILARGGAYPMVATHDAMLISAARQVLPAVSDGNPHEFQMLYGIRPDEQRRLAGSGERVRVYVPYGTQWYGYLMRRMAERPANLSLVARALFSRN